MVSLDVKSVREQFDFKGWKYFQNAGGTFTPKQVQRIVAQVSNFGGQPHGLIDDSQLLTKYLDKGIVGLAGLINADIDEIVIGKDTTSNFQQLALSLANYFTPGDRVIVTNQEHEANSKYWRDLAKIEVDVIEWSMNHKGELDLATLENHLKFHLPEFLFMNQSSNIVASVNDLATIVKMAHNYGCRVGSDSVAHLPHHVVDVKALNIDVLGGSTYKLFGTHAGLLYVKRDLHKFLDNNSFWFLPGMYKDTPSEYPSESHIKLCPGLISHSNLAGLAGLVDYIDDLYEHHFPKEKEDNFHNRAKKVFGLIEKHETELSEVFLNYIRNNNRIKLIGKDVADTKVRQPTFSFTVSGIDYDDFKNELAKRKIAVDAGNFYAHRCLGGLRIDSTKGVMRISFAHYNTVQEVKYLCDWMDKILSKKEKLT